MGSYEDYIQARVQYDIYKKHTYIQSQGAQPTWMHGAYTGKVTFQTLLVKEIKIIACGIILPKLLSYIALKRGEINEIQF